MALAYTPPGVSVAETASPSVSPLLAVPASVCLVGSPSTYGITRTEIITLTGTTAQPLANVPASATVAVGAIASVKAVDPSAVIATFAGYDTTNGFVLTSDYTLQTSGHTITRVSGGNVPDGTQCYVTYTYLPADYLLPIRLDNMADVQDRFGPAFDSAGTTILSTLSHGAQIAFENGAQSVVLQPVYYLNTGVPAPPNNATTAAASATWATTLTALRDIEDINVLVPVVGQSQASVGDSNMVAIFQEFQNHIYTMRTTANQYMIAIFGEDSSASSSVGQKATLLSHAATLSARYGGGYNEDIVFVAPSKYTRQLPGSVGTINIGGQYAACAVAGAIASRAVSASLTRKTLAGIASVADPRTKAEKNVDAAAGLMVIEQRGLNIQVRHAVTLDTTTTPKRELSVVRAKHRMVESVRSTLESQVIGQVVVDGDAPFFVAQQVAGVLEALRSNGDIVDFGDIQARTLSLDPTIIEIRFSYKPALPINYINIVFSLDLSGADVAVNDTSSASNATF